MKNKTSIMEMTVYLSEKENWTPLMTHIHRTALIAGTILGFIMGAAGVLLLITIKFM